MKATTISIVPASAEDAASVRPIISGIYARAFRRPPWNEEWSDEEAWDAIEAKMDRGADLFLAIDEDGEQIVGLGLGIVLTDDYPDIGDLTRFGLAPGSYYCIDMAVCQSHQRRGIGGQLLEARERRARELGVPAIGMRTRPDNTPCVACYTHRGYSHTGTYQVVTGHVESPRAVHVKQL
ncbi:MAG: GNAT family N-acetyltransferase [Bdellovibrionales bacterium]|nr:GNAT family N-acetyltransferase [Bdellovibrionales bacterium]